MESITETFDKESGLLACHDNSTRVVLKFETDLLIRSLGRYCNVNGRFKCNILYIHVHMDYKDTQTAVQKLIVIELPVELPNGGPDDTME